MCIPIIPVVATGGDSVRHGWLWQLDVLTSHSVLVHGRDNIDAVGPGDLTERHDRFPQVQVHHRGLSTVNPPIDDVVGVGFIPADCASLIATPFVEHPVAEIAQGVNLLAHPFHAQRRLRDRSGTPFGS
jgi:hypothetical protein